jgi:hypothetical protein
MVRDLFSKASLDETRRGLPVPIKPSRRKQEPKIAVVNFAFGDRTYQIDPQRQKVYQRFVEIESSRASAIYSVWRSQNARP